MTDDVTIMEEATEAGAEYGQQKCDYLWHNSGRLDYDKKIFKHWLTVVWLSVLQAWCLGFLIVCLSFLLFCFVVCFSGTEGRIKVPKGLEKPQLTTIWYYPLRVDINDRNII